MGFSEGVIHARKVSVEVCRGRGFRLGLVIQQGKGEREPDELQRGDAAGLHAEAVVFGASREGAIVAAVAELELVIAAGEVEWEGERMAERSNRSFLSVDVETH